MGGFWGARERGVHPSFSWPLFWTCHCRKHHVPLLAELFLTLLLVEAQNKSICYPNFLGVSEDLAANKMAEILYRQSPVLTFQGSTPDTIPKRTNPSLFLIILHSPITPYFFFINIKGRRGAERMPPPDPLLATKLPYSCHNHIPLLSL